VQEDSFAAFRMNVRYRRVSWHGDDWIRAGLSVSDGAWSMQSQHAGC